MAVVFIVLSCVFYALFIGGKEGYLGAFIGVMPFSAGLVAVLNGELFAGLVAAVVGGSFLYYVHFHNS